MGRKSRLKADLRAGRRAPTEKEERRQAMKADRRGRRVEPTVEGFERAAVSGSSRVIETLIARHTARMLGIAGIPNEYAVEALKPLLPIGVLDQAHVELGVSLRRAPTSFHGSVPALLAWGLESMLAAYRLLLVGQIIGAAVVARQQLERWTLLLADVLETRRAPGETVQEFIARCWSSHAMDLVDEQTIKHGAGEDSPAEAEPFDDEVVTTAELALDHEHIELSDGSKVCPPAVYGCLSEIIHGDLCRDTVAWESVHCLDPAHLTEDASAAVGWVCDAISLSMIQLKIATAAICRHRGLATAMERLLTAGERVEPIVRPAAELTDGENRRDLAALVRPVLPALMPLTVNEGLAEEPRRYLASRAAVYDAVIAGHLPAGRLYRDDEFVTLAFTAHRHASAVVAAAMLEREKHYYGDDFNPLNLVGRGITFTVVAEIAALCSRWTSHLPELAAAAAVVSSSLRSAYWLWLEDDDRAMAVLRCTLEQTARLRTWQIKPAKARTLEGNPSTTPRDWLEAAGWRRLGALNRALSEFAHAHRGTRWDGARHLLNALQIAPDQAIAPYTARGSALDLVTNLAAREVIRVINEMQSAAVAEAMREQLTLGGLEMSADDHALDQVFDHVWNHRQYPLGPPQFATTSASGETAAPP